MSEEDLLPTSFGGGRSPKRTRTGDCIPESAAAAVAATAAAAAAVALPVPAPPEYSGTAKAREVFALPYFYKDKKSVAVEYRDERDALLGNKSMEEVRQEYEHRLDELGEAIGVTPSRVRAYFPAVVVTTETVLNDIGIVPLNESSEVKTFRERFIEGLPSVERLRDMYRNSDTRSMALCYVTGSSGSGKTFFSLSGLSERPTQGAVVRSVPSRRGRTGGQVFGPGGPGPPTAAARGADPPEQVPRQQRQERV
jgi:hypothetical protein